MMWTRKAPRQDGWYFWKRSRSHGCKGWVPYRIEVDYVGADYYTFGGEQIDTPRGGWWLGPFQDETP